jgi:hypothetical protein
MTVILVVRPHEQITFERSALCCPMKVKIKVQSVTKLVMMTFQYMLEDKTKLRETIENLYLSIVFILLGKAKVTYRNKCEP